MTKRTRFLSFALLCSIAAAGCSGGNSESVEVFPVTGKVQLNGEPIAGVSVTFVPAAGTQGRGGYGMTDDAGNFSMKSDQRDGVPAGRYRVLFTKLTLPDGSPLPAGAMAADVGAENSLPAIYNDPENSPAEAVVQAGENSPLEFDLQASR